MSRKRKFIKLSEDELLCRYFHIGALSDSLSDDELHRAVADYRYIEPEVYLDGWFLYQLQQRIWQIQRMHALEIEIKIDLTPDYGIPFYIVQVCIFENQFKCKDHLRTNGRRLWLRYYHVWKFLLKHFPPVPTAA